MLVSRYRPIRSDMRVRSTTRIERVFVPQADADIALSGWLEGQRAIYAQLTADLESKVLTVTDEMVRVHGSDDKQFMAWHVVDDRLVELPSTLCETVIESPPWTYTLDLVREVFSVDMWIHFSMKEIPRIPRPSPSKVLE